MRARDLEQLHSVSRPSFAPDGSRVVVSVTHPSLDADATVGQLWSIPLKGEPRRITRGFRDTAPAFSPDGRWIAFSRGEAGVPSQLHVVPADGGESVALTDQKLGIGEFRWAPDSTTIAYTARVAEQGRYGTVEGIGAAAEPSRRLTTVKYKSNGLGYTVDRRAQIFSVEIAVASQEPAYRAAPLPDGSTPEVTAVPESTQLTTGDFDHSTLRYLDNELAFVSARHEERDRDLLNQVWSLGSADEPTAVTELGRLSVSDFGQGPDGSLYLLAIDMGESRRDFVGRQTVLYRDGEPITDTQNVDFGDPVSMLGFTDALALAQERSHGTIQLRGVDRDGTLHTLTSGNVEIESFATHGDTIVATVATPESFGDVAVLRDGSLHVLTDFSRSLRATGILAPTELTVDGRDGYPVHGWVVQPDGEGPHPTLLMIHGGPFAAYSVHVFDEAQVYADAGYAVVYCNPRGSGGYGEAHGRAVKEALGTVDMADVLDFLDGALDAHDTLDRSRLGILGGSYGGYLTAWTIAHDHRFAAAIVERGYLDPEAFVGSSDIGWHFAHAYNGTDHEQIRAQSPQAVAGQVTTPTLVMHSENDLRCPIDQAETYYATLALNGVETEMVIFPGEDHELSRAGRPRHRVERFEAILDWFGRYL